MKKTLVVLLILAVVAGGVFAQEFTWSGSVRMGSEIDFHPEGGDPEIKLWDNDDQDEEMGRGNVTLGYDKDGFHAELSFDVNYDDNPSNTGAPDAGSASIGGSASYDGDTYKVNVGISNIFNDPDLDSLWGYWYFMDKQLKFDVAYKGYETIYWRISDMIASAWDNLDGLSGVEVNFAPAAVEGLSVGFALIYPDYRPGFHNVTGETVLLKDVLYYAVFGAKFENDQLGIAAMYNVNGHAKDSSFNVTAKYNLSDVMSAGAEFQWENVGRDETPLAVAANFEYHSSPLVAGLTAKFKATPGQDVYTTGAHGDLTIEPYASYEIIPDTFLAKLVLDLYVNGMIRPDKTDAVTNFHITPALYFNPKADGISDDPAHALILKYDIGIDKDGVNTSSVFIGYRWAF